MVASGIIQSSITDEGHVVLTFGNSIDYIKIYEMGSDRPIEKVLLRDDSGILFTNFQEVNNNWTLALENLGIFYIECLKYNACTYKPFLIEITQNALTNNINPIITKVFES